MDKKRTCVLLELNNMQMKISTLFQDLMKENSDYKQNSENLTKHLEKVSNDVVNLKNEVEILKKHMEALKQNNEEMIDITDKGIMVFKTLNLSNINLQCECKTALDSLKKILLKLSKRLRHSKASESVHKVISVREEKIVDNCSKRYKFSDTEVQKKLESLKNFSTDFCYNEDDQKSPKKDCFLKNNSSDTVLKTLFQNTYEVIKDLKGSSSFVNETCDSELVNTIISAKIFRAVPSSPEEKNQVNKSPVFKDFGVQRHDGLSNEENDNKISTSLKLINEKFLERPNGFIASPWKKSPLRNYEKSPIIPKRVRKKLKINSPDRSQFYMLKKSNAREAEVSFSGVRKLRQTFLNIDCYKTKSSGEGLENREYENCKNENDTNESENKKLIDDLKDDDLIIESPKKVSHTFEDVKNKKNEMIPELNDLPFITPPQTSGLDLDETFISSSIVRKCNLAKKRECEELFKNETSLKRPTREMSLEHDSVPFVYKREPIRKKTERMKLPGHACAECYKYYVDAFGDIETQDLKKILNKCSRHRDRNSPALDDTPPGYWKPYLTCSTVISPSKNDAC